MTDVQYGVTYPAGVHRHHELAGYTRRVEALGFDSMWLADIVYSDSPSLDCVAALGFMAANSTTLRLGTSVLLLPLSNPVLAAKAVSSVDVLSGGRVILGIGVGESGSHARSWAVIHAPAVVAARKGW